MNKIIFILLLLLYSCNYPDIDSLPEFYSLNISMEETLDKCKINNTFKDEKEDCFIELKNLINRL